MDMMNAGNTDAPASGSIDAVSLIAQNVNTAPSALAANWIGQLEIHGIKERRCFMRGMLFSLTSKNGVQIAVPESNAPGFPLSADVSTLHASAAVRIPDGLSCVPTMDATGRHQDPWVGLSTDVIRRFLDVSCVDRELTRAARRGHLEDLLALDSWMRKTTARTLVTARTEELRAFFRARFAERRRLQLSERLLTSLHLFYAYLKRSGCRDDNPVDALPGWYARTVRARLTRILALLTTPGRAR
jgi:hypothetical protein